VINVISEAQAIVSGIYLIEQCEPVGIVPHGRERWKTTAPARFCINTAIAWVIVEIDAGFVTDLDSVPRESGIFYTMLKGRTRIATIMHDALYRDGVDRELADAAFLRAMKLEGVRARYRYPIYWAVRWFGGARYKRANVHAA
jgi:hypothetical protein